MKGSKKYATIAFVVHSIVPSFVLLQCLRTTDGTEQWANTLILYIIDFPLIPLFTWVQDNPDISNESFINIGISFFFGGFLYGAYAWWIGREKKVESKFIPMKAEHNE